MEKALVSIKESFPYQLLSSVDLLPDGDRYVN